MSDTDWTAVKVEDAVPVPKTSRSANSPVKDLVAGLKPGQSFATAKKHAQNIRQYFRTLFGKGAYTERAEGEEQVRFWRRQ